MTDLTEYDILKITAYLDTQSVVNLKNTCKPLMTLIESHLKLLERAIWSHYKGRYIHLRNHIRITPLSELIEWIFNASNKANKANIIKCQIAIEVTYVKETLNLDNHKREILLPPAIKFVRRKLHHELISLHKKLKELCMRWNTKHWKGSATPICSMEDVVYQYIHSSDTPPILITYLLIIINRSNILSVLEPRTPSETEKKDCYDKWLNELLYLVPDPSHVNPYEGHWPPKIPEKCNKILRSIAVDT